jgi:hypothetical protein
MTKQSSAKEGQNSHRLGAFTRPFLQPLQSWAHRPIKVIQWKPSEPQVPKESEQGRPEAEGLPFCID